MFTTHLYRGLNYTMLVAFCLLLPAVPFMTWLPQSDYFALAKGIASAAFIVLISARIGQLVIEIFGKLAKDHEAKMYDLTKNLKANRVGQPAMEKEPS